MKDAEIYKGKKISELLKQIVDDCADDKARALEMFEAITAECQNKEQMMLIGPVAAEYLEIAGKQTDNLIKLAETIRKYHALDLEAEGAQGLSEMERIELFKHLEDTSSDPLSQRQKESVQKQTASEEFMKVDIDGSSKK
jgi:hypothetical protein|tara:strand:- start:464 stop:883 length:420 start_codon:yes stop_codon:yes gene_type:complete